MRQLLSGALLLIAAFAASADEAFVYRAQGGDTLIAIGERLLANPSHWPRVQRLNRIGDPRRIPTGTEIRIPLAWMRREPESARVLAVRGRAESGGRPLQAGAVLGEGSVVTTGADGYATLTLPDGSELALQPESRLHLESLRRLAGTDVREISLTMEHGRAETRTAPGRSAAGRFEIRSKVAVAAVRGTEFRVGAVADAARSEVLTGTVALKSLAAEKEVRVGAGFGAFVRGAMPPAEPRPLLPVPDTANLPALQERPVVRFTLPALDGARAWRAQVATDREFRDVLGESQTDSPVVRFADLPDGDYWLRIRGVDGEGLEGLDAYHRFRLKARPEPPFLAAPAVDAKLPVGPVVFRWSEPAGAARYRFQLAQDAMFSAVIREEDNLSGSSDMLEIPAAGPYWWRMASVRADGDIGPFGDAQALTLKPLPPNPDPPTLDENELRFTWPAEPGQSFLFQIASDSQFSRIQAEWKLTEPRITMERPAPGTYYMRVRATDPDGYVGPFTAPQRIEVPEPPARPWWLLLLLLVPLL